MFWFTFFIVISVGLFFMYGRNKSDSDSLDKDFSDKKN